ncbi:hypothetical protein EDD18DRAFT_1361010 [Armillaria luteobubalina]|uniref:Phosphoribosyltransferase domain-containing protein n=1 Tax=Armillaria luteobubalina TaxID=153913 RepID=A0AA39PJP6_9AGAR|nr:hypothetical protein EDD18DRAFT_1361010 [Armillaria luteobubalina]
MAGIMAVDLVSPFNAVSEARSEDGGSHILSLNSPNMSTLSFAPYGALRSDLLRSTPASRLHSLIDRAFVHGFEETVITYMDGVYGIDEVALPLVYPLSTTFQIVSGCPLFLFSSLPSFHINNARRTRPSTLVPHESYPPFRLHPAPNGPDEDTSRGDFLFYSDRIIRLLAEEWLNHLPVMKRTVMMPTGTTYEGYYDYRARRIRRPRKQHFFHPVRVSLRPPFGLDRSRLPLSL